MTAEGRILPGSFGALLSAVMALSTGSASGRPESEVRPFADSAKTAHRKSIYDLSLEELGRIGFSPFEVDFSLDEGYRASNSVSGSRFDSPIRDLPFALQAFTESFIRDQKPRDIFDIARYSPGVTYRSNDFNEGNANLAIRGFAVSSLSGGNIPVVRDGFHGPTIFDFTNVERVEVLKGPSSFLYGQVAPGGMVNIITKSPRPRFGAIADARYGSFGEYRFDADVTGPIVESLLFRATASYDQDIDYWKPYDARSHVVAPSLLWRPFDRVSVTLKYERFRKDESPQVMQKPWYNTQGGLVPTAEDPNRSGVDVPGLPDTWNSMSYGDYRYSETNALSGWIDVKASDRWDLRVGSSYQDNTIDALFSGNLGMANNTTFLQGRRQRWQTYSNEDATVEAQAVGRYGFPFASLRLLLGGQYADRRLDREAAQAPNDPALGSDPTASPLPLWDLRDPSTWNRDVSLPIGTFTASAYHETNDYTDRSAYGGATFGFLDDRLLALLGWRLTSTENRMVDELAAQPIFRGTSSETTPQYGALYKITPGISVFGTYSESFVPGTNLPENQADKPVEPVSGRGIDIGIKADLLGGRVSGTLAGFDIRNRNIVNDLATTDSNGLIIIVREQSGEQRSRGVEMDATLAATEAWQIYASYSWMDARNLEFSGRDAEILAQDTAALDAAGRQNFKNVLRFHRAPLQMSAPHLANLWTRYNLMRGGLRGAYIAGGFNFVYDQTLLPDSPASSRQTYALFNAMAGYSWAWNRMILGAAFSGRNLSDARYRPSQSTRSRPRELFLTLTARI